VSNENYDEYLEALLDKARGGNKASFDELMESCRNYLLLIANQELDPRLHPKLGPSDIVQSAMLAAHENWDQFRGTSREEFLAWIRQIVLRGLQRSQRRYVFTGKRDVRREVPLARLGDDEVVPGDLPGRESPPHIQVSIEERRLLLETAINKLPAEYRAAIEARSKHQLSFAQIAQQMGRSEDAVQKLWQRAIIRLRSELRKLNLFSGQLEDEFSE
jgi:RNA polymerase sigma-70 factor, ECF subfamily